MGRMKDFKRFMSFVGKEFNHILRDTRTLMVLIVMPVVMIVLFGFALSTEIKDVKVAVYDPSRDAATSRLISQIDASEYFTVTAFIDSEEGVLEAFRSNSADIALVFEDNFYHRAVHDSDGRLQVIVDGSNTNIGSMAVFYVSSIVSSFQKELAQEAALNQAAAGGSSSSAEAIPSVQIHTSTRMMYNPQMKSAFNFVPGVMGMILMLVCAMMTSVSIVRVGLAGEALLGDTGQGYTILRGLGLHLADSALPVGVPDKGADIGQPDVGGAGVAAVHPRVAVDRHPDIYPRGQAGSGDTYLGYGAHAPYDAALGHAFPHREHAEGAAVDILLCARQMVY